MRSAAFTLINHSVNGLSLVWGSAPAEACLAADASVRLVCSPFPATRAFMMLVALLMLLSLWLLLMRTRIGLVIQAALTHPEMVEALGHNVPRVFMLVFGAGTGLAGLAGVIGGSTFVTEPAMAATVGSVIFVVVVVGGMGSLSGAFLASVLIGVIQTFAVAFDYSFLSLAQQMGMPAGGFRVATNQNDILHRFFTSGEYSQSDVHPSHAPSMDIQAASNFERFLYYILGQSAERVREVMAQIKSGAPFKIELPKTSLRSTRMDDDQIVRVIAQMWQDWQYVLDPHTACAFTDMAQDRVSVVLATASPAKFPEVVQQATGNEPKHPTLEALKSKSLQTWPMAADVATVQEFILQRTSHGSKA